MDNGREGNHKSERPAYEFEILNLRLRYLERYRQTSSLSDWQLWEIVEYIDRECQLQTMWDIGTYDGK